MNQQYQTQQLNQQQQYGYSNQSWVNPQQSSPRWSPSAPPSDLPPSYTDAVNTNPPQQEIPKIIR